MARRNRRSIRERKQAKIGAPPGSAIYVGEDRTSDIIIEVHTYNVDKIEYFPNFPLSKLETLSPDCYHWVNVIGVHDVEIIKSISKIYDIHVLTIEDILNTVGRPKCEIYDDYIFSSLKMLKNEFSDILVEDEQVSLILKKNVVISFQELKGDVFQAIRDRLQNPESRARRKKADYLFFLLHDIIVDNYIAIIDLLEEFNQQLEKAILGEVNHNQLYEIQKLKSEVLYLKRIAYPVKESIAKIMRSDCRMIEAETKLFFNDVQDHLEYTNEGLESQFDIIVGQRELYMSMMSMNMNNVMKVLTIISSIFIPLTFIVGVYGMNFDHMPELRTRYGYFIVLGVMLVLSIFMLFYFRRKRWM